MLFFDVNFICRNFNAQLKQKTLELQIADLKIKQHEEKLVQEQSRIKLYAEQVSQLLATEKNLRSQLTADGEKFQQFQVKLLLVICFHYFVTVFQNFVINNIKRLSIDSFYKIKIQMVCLEGVDV